MTSPILRKAVAMIGLVAATATMAGAQSVEISTTSMELDRYLTTADNSNPGGLGLWPNGSVAASGSPTLQNDPNLGFNNTRYWAKDPEYSGVTQLIMTYQRKNMTTGAISSAAFICSGAVINSGYSVLTAAHCVNNRTQNEGGTNFQYTLQSTQVRLGQHFGGNTTHEPGAGAPSVNAAFNYVQNVGAANHVLHSSYSGQVIDQHDIAVINLNSQVPPEYNWYELYDDSAFDTEYNIVGWGGRGNGANGVVSVGGSAGQGQRIRQGQNTWETTYADSRWTDAFKTFLFGARGGQDVYLADFDNGLAGNDALCQLSFATLGGVPIWTDPANRPCDTGEGIDEVSSAGGDSGGPSFVMGQIAAVTSFGQTWGTGFFGDVKAGLNSSFGEINGMTRVDINASFVRGAVVTPEPATFVLFGTGFLGLIAVARRRRR